MAGAALTKASFVRDCGNTKTFSRRSARLIEADLDFTTGVPEVPIKRHELGGEAAKRPELLAMLELRRSVESQLAGGRAVTLVEPLIDALLLRS